MIGLKIRMTFSPKVTVLMPVYNGEMYLCQAIDSILTQTYSDFEFLIINDGSQDNSAEIISSYEDPRIRVITNDRNLNLRASLNKGVQLARGQYISRMDCDDISSPDRLDKQISYLEEHPQVGILGTAVCLIDSQGKVFGKVELPTAHDLICWSLFFSCPIVHPTVTMRKDLIIHAGGYDTEMVHAEDYDLWCRLIGKTRFANLEERLLWLRKHNKNITEIYSTMHIQMVMKVHRKRIYEELGERPDSAVLEGIRIRPCKSFGEQEEAANLVLKLYGKWKNNEGLEAIEKKLVTQDAAFRVFMIAVSRIYDFRIGKIFKSACQLDPLVPWKFVLDLFERASRLLKRLSLSFFSSTPPVGISKKKKGWEPIRNGGGKFLLF